MRTYLLDEADALRLRQWIAADGIDGVSARMAVPRGTVARAAAGARLLRVSRTAILAGLEAFDRGRRDVAAGARR
jgi:hypothetical protein